MFPRTEVGGLSLPRMIAGSNWFMGFSHTTAAKDNYIKCNLKNTKKIADILEVYLRAGIDAVMGCVTTVPMHDAVKEAEDRVGRKFIIISTPSLPVGPDLLTKGWDIDALSEILDTEAKLGTSICMPHQSTTDALLDRITRKIRGMDKVSAMIRERGMIPGLSTHMPESVTYADESGLDIETYIQIFNTMGFLMQVEVDWIARIINEAKKPVMTIKPMAAGQVRPLQGLTFAWNAIRAKDMVTVGAMTPDEAAELIEISLKILEHRNVDIKLQETRSKASIKTKK